MYLVVKLTQQLQTRTVSVKTRMWTRTVTVVRYSCLSISHLLHRIHKVRLANTGRDNPVQRVGASMLLINCK